jgi:O-antigen/teichoic acid export membrane protein
LIVFFDSHSLSNLSIWYLTSQYISLFIGTCLWLHLSGFKIHKLNCFTFSKLTNGIVALFSIVVFGLILNQAPIIWGGIHLDNKEIAKLSIALKVSTLLSFFLVSINMVIAPKLAVLYNSGSLDQLESLLKLMKNVLIILVLPIIIIVMLFSHEILSLFGNEYIEASGLLLVLLVGQIINVGTGSVGVLLMMSGHGSKLNVALIVSAIYLMMVIYFFLDSFGTYALAFAISTSLALQNLLAYYFVVKKLKVKIW